MKVLLLTLFLISHMAYAGKCVTKKTPLCPEGGSTVLPETYPASAYVVSTKTYNYTKAGQSMPENFITEIMDGHDFNAEEMPTFYLPTSKYSFDEVTKRLEKKLEDRGIKSKEIRKLLSSLAHVDADGYMWQQDYMQSTFNAETGKPINRVISRYSRTPLGATRAMERSKRDCAPENGRPIGFARKMRPHHMDAGMPGGFDGDFGGSGGGFGGGEFNMPKPEPVEQWIEGHPGTPDSKMGGNIEAIPGGICLTGDNQSDEFMKEWCNDLDYAVKVDVDWLTVGHVDEVVKVIPNGKKNFPCNFSIMVASPDKAIELMKKDRETTMFDLSDIPDKDMESSLETRFTPRSLGPGKYICSLYIDEIRTEMERNPTKTPTKLKQVETVLNIILGETVNADEKAPSYKTCNEEQTKMKNITNGQFIDAFLNNEELATTNRLIQEKMDKAKRDMARQLAKHLPQCGSPDFIDVPDLFHTDGIVTTKNGPELPLPGSGDSFFPNPTNSVVVGNKVVFSDPENDTFRAYQRNELNKRKVKTGFVDTWDTSHLAKGNLHCITNSQRFCKPRR